MDRAPNGVATLPQGDFVQSVNSDMLYTVQHDLGPREDFYLMMDGAHPVLMTPSKGAWEGGVMFMEFKTAYWIDGPQMRVRFYRTNYKAEAKLEVKQPTPRCGKCETCECRNPGVASWLE